MAELTSTEQVNTDNGHLVVHPEGLRAPELTFSFEHVQSGVRLGASVVVHLFFLALAIFVMTYGPAPGASAPVEPDKISDKIVWLSEPGPGGGGGGGGNQMKEPPKKAEVPGKEKISVPVERPPAPKPELPKPEEIKEPTLNIPAKTMADAQQISPGLLESAMNASMISQGLGTQGGAGTGEGTGIGRGKGAGLGEGSGGGTGGGVYRPGNGVELPRPIHQPRPNYTADAMRAKVQGMVQVEAVVMPDGTVGDVSVTKSLDSVFGLDQEAIKAAKQWRFLPGRRLGQPVAVLVTIELTFTLR